MSTRIERSWPRTIVRLSLASVVAAAGLWLAAWALSGDELRVVAWPVVFLIALAAGFLFRAAARAPGKARCPHCGSSVSAIPDPRRAVRCRRCDDWARVVDGRLVPLPDDWVDADPRFPAELPRGSVLWPGCAMCGAPPTRRRMHEHHIQQGERNALVNLFGIFSLLGFGGGLFVGGGGKIHTLSVPYCDAHDYSADLDMEDGRIVVLFRSPRVRDAFVELNAEPDPEI